jgi:riboflavin kinase/FMN adenylyltransferase
MTPEIFLKDILAQLNLKHLIIGDDFRFGAERAGDFSLLKSWGKSNNTEVIANKTVSKHGLRISSTRIREALMLSNFELAAELLGRPYTFSGKVVYGNQLGRTIGVPTANLGYQNKDCQLLEFMRFTASWLESNLMELQIWVLGQQ